MPSRQAEVRELNEGDYILVDEEPCEIIKLTTSSPGKHGSAKANIQVEGIFDGQKRRVKHTVTDKVKVPIVDKNRRAQVSSVNEGDGTALLMDLETYDQFRLPIPDGADLEQGEEVTYLRSMDKEKITGH